MGFLVTSALIYWNTIPHKAQIAEKLRTFSLSPNIRRFSKKKKSILSWNWEILPFLATNSVSKDLWLHNNKSLVHVNLTLAVRFSPLSCSLSFLPLPIHTVTLPRTGATLHFFKTPVWFASRGATPTWNIDNDRLKALTQAQDTCNEKRKKNHIVKTDYFKQTTTVTECSLLSLHSLSNARVHIPVDVACVQ